MEQTTNLCRFCLDDINLNATVFDQLETNQTIAQLAEECFSIQIDNTPEHPQLVCDKCKRTLNMIASFKETTEQVDQIVKHNMLDAYARVKQQQLAEFAVTENIPSVDTCQIDTFNVTDTSDTYYLISLAPPVENATGKNLNDVHQTDDVNDDHEECVICHKSFARATYQEHCNFGHDDILINGKYCITCHREFDTSKSLKSHVTHAHATLICPFCGDTFVTDRRLAAFHRHVRAHEQNAAKYTCPLCQYHAPYQKTLWSHFRDVHNDAKPYACAECANTFALYSELRSHVEWKHGGEKPSSVFVCDKCGKVFERKCSLRTHRRIHTDVYRRRQRGHKCETCERKFASPGLLRQHIQTRHSDTPVYYRCTHCSTAFTMRKNLYQHQRRKHQSEKPFDSSVIIPNISRVAL